MSSLSLSSFRVHLIVLLGNWDSAQQTTAQHDTTNTTLVLINLEQLHAYKNCFQMFGYDMIN